MKQIGYYNLLDNLESSGSKIIANGPIVRKLCDARTVDDIRSGNLNFSGLPVYYPRQVLKVQLGAAGLVPSPSIEGTTWVAGLLPSPSIEGTTWGCRFSTLAKY